MNPNFKKKKPLPYKNLGELYIETAYHEPSISRLVSVLLEDGTVDVISQDTSDPEAPAQDYEVDKEYFNNEIKPRLVLGRPDKITVRTIIAKRLLNLNAQNIPTTIDMYQEFIEGLGIVLDDDKAKKFGSALTGEYTKNTFSNLLKDTYALKADPSSDDRWQAVFKAKPEPIAGGRKQPGDGELFISFFSNNERPLTGDVQIGDVKIEVKGPLGRLYKSLVSKPLEPVGFLLTDPEAVLGEKQSKFIVDFIIKLAGGGDADEIKKLVQSHLSQLYNEIISSRASVSRNKRFVTVSVKATPLLAQIIGAQQLLLYKNAENFRNFLIFNNDKTYNFICFMVPDTLQDILNIFVQNKISILTSSDADGHKILWTASSKNA